MNPAHRCELGRFRLRSSRNGKCHRGRGSLAKPHAFIRNSRVEPAKELLTEPNCSIAAVASSVGFHNTLHLDRAFRRLIGMTPSSYRNQVADNQSNLRRQKPADASDLRAHAADAQHDADHGETTMQPDQARVLATIHRFSQTSKPAAGGRLQRQVGTASWPRIVTPTRIVFKKTRHSASCAACACAIAP